ncbi:MAG: hypothetical protein ACJ72Z_08315 [Pyrinomonadaceae bacterium]
MNSNPSGFLYSFVFVLCWAFLGCSVEAKKAEVPADSKEQASKTETSSATKGATIEIAQGSPSETVRAFYAKLRERKIREAIFLTNLRPAIEGLTDDELKEYAVDFDAVARVVPADIEINGEIVSGDTATVTAKLPDDDDKLSLQQIRLRRQGDNWVILSADEATEKIIQKEGKNYFHNLRIETHESEAKTMLDRIAKAEMVYSLQNKGEYADFPTLIGQGLLPSDITSSESTGYNYQMKVAGDRKQYTAFATPAVYGKSGKTSYRLESNKDGKPGVKSGDNGGKPFDK